MRLILAGQVIGVCISPPVVDHAVGYSGVIVTEQLEEAERASMFAGVRPLDVVPDEIGLIAID